MSDQSTPLLLVRFRAGVVGERARQCHIVPAPQGATMPTRLVALCGTEFAPGQAELLPRPMGMPCEACLLSVPLPCASVATRT
jgi:hypothetical protein